MPCSTIYLIGFGRFVRTRPFRGGNLLPFDIKIIHYRLHSCVHPLLPFTPVFQRSSLIRIMFRFLNSFIYLFLQVTAATPPRIGLISLIIICTAKFCTRRILRGFGRLFTFYPHRISYLAICSPPPTGISPQRGSLVI